MMRSDGKLYNVTRRFFDGDDELILSEVTLEEARAHCRDPETSSRTCTRPELVKLTARRGSWFDSFDEA
jgi:hypothetical protein